MAYTAQEIFNMTMDLMSKRSSSGTIDTNRTASYRVKTPSLLTLWQNGISRLGDLFSTFEFSNKPIKNLLGDQFDIKEFVGTDLTFECDSTSSAYYFETDGEGTVYIEDYTTQWNTLGTILVPSSVNSFTAYKGVITPTTGATKTRIRFSGTYYYKTVNRALFVEPFSPTRIPDYKMWTKHTMPTDFKSVDQIIEEESGGGYAIDASYKWEGRKDLYINYNFNGNIRIVYKPIPTKITAMTDLIEVDDITAMSGAYYLATHLLLVEDSDQASFFNSMYEDLKKAAIKKNPASENPIQDVYGMWGE